MPNIKSAIKRVKVSEKKNLRNRMVKSSMRTSIRKFAAAVAEDPAGAEVLMRSTVSNVDKAASKGVIHKNTANRRKARFAKELARQNAAR